MRGEPRMNLARYSTVGDSITLTLAIILLFIFHFLYHNMNNESLLVKASLIILSIGSFSHLLLFTCYRDIPATPIYILYLLLDIY